MNKILSKIRSTYVTNWPVCFAQRIFSMSVWLASTMEPCRSSCCRGESDKEIIISAVLISIFTAKKLCRRTKAQKYCSEELRIRVTNIRPHWGKVEKLDRCDARLLHSRKSRSLSRKCTHWRVLTLKRTEAPEKDSFKFEDVTSKQVK